MFELNLSKNNYLIIMMILSPILNMLPGVSLELISPALPIIQHDFSISSSLMKSLISFNILGFCIGCLIVGLMMEFIGRKITILIGLLIFMCSNLLSPFCNSINLLLLMRFLQGFSIVVAAIGSRAIITHTFTGQAYTKAIINASTAYSAGIILSPFIGSYLVQYFGWHSCFFLSFTFTLLIFINILCFLENDCSDELKPKMIKEKISNFFLLTKNHSFMKGTLIVGLTFFLQIIFATVGPAIVENTLHLSVIIYGKFALLMGLAYLIGNIINRILIEKFPVEKIQKGGFYANILTGLIQIIFSFQTNMNLYVFVIPLIFMNFFSGFIYGNTSAMTLKSFKINASSAIAMLLFLSAVVGYLGSFGLSVFHIKSITEIGLIIFLISLFQLLLIKSSHLISLKKRIF
ncbi:hypothetical protein CF386_10215 [Paraphotobacterium marinum]|uniref:Major facilitator superfamily (MFS) profile domain-containing protein n=1 Tax=Paraphotobacterium marinum TaxID=1755811 RepID=A0A220VGD6_9GAMM|nr:MFS transporter [Paraphotobacterium marinum]ASK79425.1 hypothetical protein CF386_10215 [Paraphotobacterium marinum]